jgi:hypothetical protein
MRSVVKKVICQFYVRIDKRTLDIEKLAGRGEVPLKINKINK